MHNNPIPITERTTNERAERASRLENLVDYVGRIGSLPENSVDFAITAPISMMCITDHPMKQTSY